MYFGSWQNDIQIRFYEKNIEQIMKGNEIPKFKKTDIQICLNIIKF
ncbi:hypothetical protein [Lysinibacillus sp. RS5]